MSKKRDRYEKFGSLILGLALLLLGIGFFFFQDIYQLFGGEILDGSDGNSTLFYALGVVVITVAVSLLIYAVLDKNIGRSVRFDTLNHKTFDYRDERLALLETQLARMINEGQLNKEPSSSELKEVKDTKNLEREENNEKEPFQNNKFKNWARLLISSMGRMEGNIVSFIDKLTRNATINLSIGISIFLVATVLLLWLIFQEGKAGNKESKEFLSFYIPRLSIYVFAEILSFFFLKLYRSNLSQVKSLEDQLTRIRLRFLGLELACGFEFEDSVKDGIKEFYKQESTETMVSFLEQMYGGELARKTKGSVTPDDLEALKILAKFKP